MNGPPDFIPQHPPLCDPQMPPPYRFENVGMRIFLLPAAAVLLQKVCKRFFNDIAVRDNLDFRITPIADIFGNSHVYLEVLTYPKIYSLAPNHAQLGYIEQNEFFVSIPVVFEDVYGLPLGVGMFVPFIFVDKDWSVIAGRDVMGFPKGIAEFRVDAVPSKIDGTAAKSLVLSSYGADQRATTELILEINAADLKLSKAAASQSLQVDPNATPIHEYWPFGPVDELFGEGQPRQMADDVLDLLKQSAGVQMVNYTLKQFRDAAEPSKACFQSILECRMTVDGLSAGGTYPPLDITLPRHDSLEIAKRLGIPVTGGGVAEPIFGFWYQADFTLHEAERLHTVCGGKEVATDAGPTTSDFGVTGDECDDSIRRLCKLNLKVYKSCLDVWLNTVEACIGKPK